MDVTRWFTGGGHEEISVLLPILRPNNYPSAHVDRHIPSVCDIYRNRDDERSERERSNTRWAERERDRYKKKEER